ncbi:Spherulation-specific family 4 [Lophiotrema nucula]|uniref:Spherulation-specific family 4 n=1 Tax=Lophiotrema nucula TaxID=690887 RepID=A0A6A5YRR8_9PLEO|nr:Spherulation-specific family 4 [Lophiotrema nucula]
MSILLPLYIYPWAGWWDPLYWAAGNNTRLNFTVILNPCSGPCVNSRPEDPYIVEMPKLKDYPNIRTLGYVATNYTNKPIETVLAEIQTYNNWTSTLGSQKLAVDGVFFDETPGVYDWQWYDYLKKASQAVKGSAGLGQKVVVFNPGNIPGIYSNYLDLADITVVFEETYLHWLDKTNFEALKNLAKSTGVPQTTFAIMLHDVPNIPDDLLDWTTKQLKEMAGWGFLSSVGVAGEYWHSFSSLFDPFIRTYAKAS